MMDGSDSGSGLPPRKLKFAPKIPVRKSPKPAVVKTDLSARTDDIVDRELLAKLSGAKSQDNGRRFKSDKKGMIPDPKILYSKLGFLIHQRVKQAKSNF